MKVLVNFASHSFAGVQKENSKQGVEIAHFERVIEYTPESLSAEFKEKNAAILGHEKGCGYWVWLPYILLDAMDKTQEGDYIFYCNSGATWLNDVKFLVDELEALRSFALLFYSYDDRAGTPFERMLTRRDAFVLMECDSPEYANTCQLFAGYMLFRNCKETREFLSQYLAYCQDPRILVPGENVCSKENYPDFREHMSNQSILSLLAKKWKLPISMHMPDQFRRPQILQYDRRRY